MSLMGPDIAYYYGAPESILGFWCGSCYPIFSFWAVFSQPMIVICFCYFACLFVCFVCWFFVLVWLLFFVLNILQKRWFQSPHCELSIYIPAAPAYRVYIYLSWYSRACGSYQDFLDRVAVDKESTESRVHICYVEIITSKVLPSPPWLGWLLWIYLCHKWARMCSICHKHLTHGF